jgi:DNA polymerase I-like protein with 3'-5' exonuclease and polymerase domains
MRTEICKRLFDVHFWRPGEPVLVSRRLAIDTETERLQGGAPIKPVLMQVACGASGQVHLVWHKDMPQYLEQLQQANPPATWLMHNAPFDCDVLGLLGTDQLHRRIQEGQLVDTAVRFLLHRLNHGDDIHRFNLEYAAKALLHYTMDKDEDIRLTFRQDMIQDKDLEAFREWFERDCQPNTNAWTMTERHLRYAAIDPIVTYLLGEKMDPDLPTEDVQLRGFFGLYWIGRNGFQVDLPYLENLRREFLAKMEVNRDVLSMYGYYPGEAGGDALLQEILAVFERHMEVQFNRTAKKQKIQINDSTEEILDEEGRRVPRFITAYRSYRHDEKIVSTYLDSTLVGVDGRVHPFFSPMVRTGRTSCSKPNIFRSFFCNPC